MYPRKGDLTMLAVHFNKQEKTQIRSLRFGAFLTFMGINIRFIVGEIIKPLILFGFLQPGGYGHNRYEFHVPSMPDMCGDVVTIVLLTAAYLFMTSTGFKYNIRGMMYGSCDKEEAQHESVKKIRDYIITVKNVFIITVIGFSLYFLSKYAFTTGLEAFSSDESGLSAVSYLLRIVNDALKLLAAIAFVYAYCKYIGANKVIKPVLYSFFLLNNLLLSNLLGFYHGFDLEMLGPVMDALMPGLLIYITIDFMVRTRAVRRLKEAECLYPS